MSPSPTPRQCTSSCSPTTDPQFPPVVSGGQRPDMAAFGASSRAERELHRPPGGSGPHPRQQGPSHASVQPPGPSRPSQPVQAQDQPQRGHTTRSQPLSLGRNVNLANSKVCAHITRSMKQQRYACLLPAATLQMCIERMHIQSLTARALARGTSPTWPCCARNSLTNLPPPPRTDHHTPCPHVQILTACALVASEALHHGRRHRPQ